MQAFFLCAQVGRRNVYLQYKVVVVDGDRAVKNLSIRGENMLRGSEGGREGKF